MAEKCMLRTIQIVLIAVLFIFDGDRVCGSLYAFGEFGRCEHGKACARGQNFSYKGFVIGQGSLGIFFAVLFKDRFNAEPFFGKGYGVLCEFKARFYALFSVCPEGSFSNVSPVLRMVRIRPILNMRKASRMRQKANTYQIFCL